jgi:hypothetical protein
MSTANNPKTKKKTKGRKSNATKLAHKKFRWLLKQVALDPRMPLLALRACMVVCDHASLDHNGQAIIGQDIIAKKLGVWRQQVSSALRQAVALGHLEAIRRGRDHANAYRMVLKDELPAADDVCKSKTSSMSANADIKPDMMSANADFDVCKSQTHSPFSSPGPLTEAPERGETTAERETEFAERAEETEPPAGAGGASPGGGPPADAGPRREHAPAAAPPSRQEPPTERPQSPAQEEKPGAEKFDELRAIWARPWPDDVAVDQRAFEMACREVAPDDIIAAAGAWVAAADNPRFLPSLAKWLTGRGWEKPPPEKKTKRGGNGARPGRKPDLAEIGLNLARMYEAEAAAERGGS